MSEIFKYGIGIYSEFPLDLAALKHSEEPITSESTHADIVRVTQEIPHLFSTITDEDSFIKQHKKELKNVHVITLRENEVREKPILLEFSGDAKTKFEHVLIIANKHSQATILESVSGDSLYRSAIVEIIAQEGSNITYKNIQALSPTTTQVVRRYSQIHQDAKLLWVDAQLGSRYTQLVTKNTLLEPRSEVNSKSAYVLCDDQEFDINTTAQQMSEETKADLSAKAVLKGKSKLIYRGLVHIGEDTQESEGYQQADALLLEPSAKANLVPNLEIKNPDVKCSHGATVGKMNKEHLFYLQTRGLSEEQAKQVLVEGFLSSLLTYLDEEQTEQVLERVR